MVIPLIIVMVIVVAVILVFSSHHRESYNSGIKGDRSWREDNADGSFTIYDKHGAGTVIKTYEGGERYINGHRVNSADDMAKWYVKKGFGEGLERRLCEIERELEKLNSDGGNELLKEWDERYATYRKLCIETGMWNWIIGDRATFIPTITQLEMEKKRRENVDVLYHQWQERLLDNQVVLNYLDKAPRKHCLKKTLIKELATDDPEKKKQIQTIYRRLLKAEIIGEKSNEKGEIETRLIVRRKAIKKELSAQPASTYHPDTFANIRMSDIYKVDYTVAEPEDLNKTNGTCFFTSKSSGERYATSLERCSCPAYCKGYACKHMLALAMQLGYFSRSSVTR